MRRPTPHREDQILGGRHVGALVDALTSTGRTVLASDVRRQQHGFLQLDYLNDQPPEQTQGTVPITCNPTFILFEGNSDSLANASDLLA